MARRTTDIAALRRLSAAQSSLSSSPSRPAAVPIPLGAAIDRALPGGGLARGALHEVAGAGEESEHGGVACLFVAGCLAPLDGVVLWIGLPPLVYPPALAGAGLHPDRVIYAEAARPTEVLLAMEDSLRHAGLAGVVGELPGRLSLTASRRLQLAAEASGVPAFLLRRTRRSDGSGQGAQILAEPCAAVTRWRLASLPSPPPVPEAPEVRGLARARWRLDLVRCRGAAPASWIVEAADAQGRLGVLADLEDRPAVPRVGRRAA